MEPLDPILKITFTIENLHRDLKRKQINYDRFIAKNYFVGLKSKVRNRPAIKRNFKFYRYYCNQAIKYLKDYRDLLMEIHKVKEDIAHETDNGIQTQEVNNTA